MICIAVIHHYSTQTRRIAAIQALLEALAPEGQVLIYVWALEQKTSRRGWDKGDPQDIMVPWKTKELQITEGSAKTKVTEGEETVYQRYYHLFKKGDLESDVVQAGGKAIKAGYDRDNWWVIATK